MPITNIPTPVSGQDELIVQVEQQLLRLRISPHLGGFTYLAAAICQTIRDPERLRYITKEIYPSLGRAYGVGPSPVERAMRTAVRRGWECGNGEALSEMAGYQIRERPTNSEFIGLVAVYIRHRA